MIFFIVRKTDRPGKNYRSVTTPGPPDRFARPGNYVIVSWNEVFPSLDDLTEWTIQVATRDEVCRAMAAQSVALHGFDPFSLAAAETVDATFRHFAHPMIGNLVNSPRVRPVMRVWQYLENWSGGAFLDVDTRNAILRLLTHMRPLQRSGRDQVRVCYNVTELARAVIGEVTSAPGRRLEKILALRLCRSERLHAAQRGMLRAYLGARGGRLLDAARNRGVEGFEYIRYYLPDDARDIPKAEAEPLARALIASALGEEPDLGACGRIEAGLLRRCMASWQSLPHVIRCAALMNDIRKLDDVRAEVGQTDRKVSMCCPPEVLAVLLDRPDRPDPPYAIAAAAGLKHVPTFVDSHDLTWSWNRDEIHEATLTYRYHLCPLWAGASGHTVGGIQFWMHVLGRDFPRDGAMVVTAGLFTLWRLYYDKRISGCHTLVETFEASCTAQVTGERGLPVPVPEPRLDARPDDDAFVQVAACSFRGRGGLDSVDPIALTKLLRRLYCPRPEDTGGLRSTVEREREELANRRFWIPMWSRELSVASGMEVCSLTRRDANTLVFLNPEEELRVQEQEAAAPPEPVVYPVTGVQVNYGGDEFVRVVFEKETWKQDGKQSAERAGFFGTTVFPGGGTVRFEVLLGRAGGEDGDVVEYRRVHEGTVTTGTTDTVVDLA